MSGDLQSMSILVNRLLSHKSVRKMFDFDDTVFREVSEQYEVIWTLILALEGLRNPNQAPTDFLVLNGQSGLLPFYGQYAFVSSEMGTIRATSPAVKDDAEWFTFADLARFLRVELYAPYPVVNGRITDPLWFLSDVVIFGQENSSRITAETAFNLAQGAVNHLLRPSGVLYILSLWGVRESVANSACFHLFFFLPEPAGFCR